MNAITTLITNNLSTVKYTDLMPPQDGGTMGSYQPDPIHKIVNEVLTLWKYDANTVQQYADEQSTTGPKFKVKASVISWTDFMPGGSLET